MSDRYDPAIADKFGATACIAITDPPMFAQALASCILDKSGKGAMGFVTYQSRAYHPSEAFDNHPVWIKDSSYRDEHEWRIIWEPRQPGLLTPFTIDCPQAAQYCQLVEMPGI